MKKGEGLPRTSRVNDKILEYYLKFGKDRDLEKFMRLYSPASSRSNPSRATNATTTTTTTSNETENSDDSCCGNAYSDTDAGALKRVLQEKGLYHHHPHPHHYPSEEMTSAISLPNMELIFGKAPSKDKRKHCSQPNHVKIIPIETSKPEVEEKINDAKDYKTPEKLDEGDIPIRTPESVAKIHKRLEWDSLGDVGYLKSKSTSNISTIERSLLKELFQEISTPAIPKINSSESDLKRLEKEQFSSFLRKSGEYNTPPLASSTFINSNIRKIEERLRKKSTIFVEHEKENFIEKQTKPIKSKRKVKENSKEETLETIVDIPNLSKEPQEQVGKNSIKFQMEEQKISRKEQSASKLASSVGLSEDQFQRLTEQFKNCFIKDQMINQQKDSNTQTDVTMSKTNRKVQVDLAPGSHSSLIGSSITPNSFEFVKPKKASSKSKSKQLKSTSDTSTSLGPSSVSSNESSNSLSEGSKVLHPFIACLNQMLNEQREIVEKRKKECPESQISQNEVKDVNPLEETDMNPNEELKSLQKMHETFKEVLEEKNNGASKSKNKKISIEGTTLGLGVQLLCKLVDDEHLEKQDKHKLVRDIIKRIVYLSNEKLDFLLESETPCSKVTNNQSSAKSSNSRVQINEVVETLSKSLRESNESRTKRISKSKSKAERSSRGEKDPVPASTTHYCCKTTPLESGSAFTKESSSKNQIVNEQSMEKSGSFPSKDHVISGLSIDISSSSCQHKNHIENEYNLGSTSKSSHPTKHLSNEYIVPSTSTSYNPKKSDGFPSERSTKSSNTKMSQESSKDIPIKPKLKQSHKTNNDVHLSDRNIKGKSSEFSKNTDPSSISTFPNNLYEIIPIESVKYNHLMQKEVTPKSSKLQYKIPPFKIVSSLRASQNYDDASRQEISDFVSTTLSPTTYSNVTSTTNTSSTRHTAATTITSNSSPIQKPLPKSCLKSEPVRTQEWLDPLTQSEIDYEKRSKEKRLKSRKKPSSLTNLYTEKHPEQEKYAQTFPLPYVAPHVSPKNLLRISNSSEELHIYDDVKNSSNDDPNNNNKRKFNLEEIDLIIEDGDTDKELKEARAGFAKEFSSSRCVIYDVPHKEVIYDSADIGKVDRKTFSKRERREKSKSKQDAGPVKPPRKQSIQISRKISTVKEAEEDEYSHSHDEGILGKPRSKMNTPSDTMGSESVDSFINQRYLEFREQYTANKKAFKEELKLQRKQQEELLLHQKEKLIERELKNLKSQHIPLKCPHTFFSCYNHLTSCYYQCHVCQPMGCQCPHAPLHPIHRTQSVPPPQSKSQHQLQIPPSPPPPPPTSTEYSNNPLKEKQRSKPKVHKTHFTTSPFDKSSPSLTLTSDLLKNNASSKSKSTNSILSTTSEVSVPMGLTNSSTTTTTHQYDEIAEDLNIRNQDIPCATSSERGTKACGLKIKPKGIAYIIQFDKSGNRKKTPSSQKIEASGARFQLQPISEERKLTGKSTKMMSVNQDDIMEKEEELSSMFYLTLQEHLQHNNAGFLKRAKERKEILNNLQSHRQERQRQLRNIIENTSIHSLERKLSKLPPPPRSNKSIFRTKEMRARTKQKFINLPEVVAKKQREREEKKRKNHRILRDIFNRRLQGYVRKGKLSLNNSEFIV